MKSEKAKQRLYESFTFNSNIGIDRKAAIEAVELAEQEAEERMRRKAIEAFGEGCFAMIKVRYVALALYKKILSKN